MTSGVLLPHTSGYNERDVILLLFAELKSRRDLERRWVLSPLRSFA